MKQLKLEDNIDLKEKKPSILRNNKGVSLIELMITSAIGIIVSLGIATVFIFAMEQFTILVEKNAAQESSMMIMYNLRNYLSQGVDVHARSNVDPAWGGVSGAGQVDVNFELLVPGTWGGGGDAGQFARFAAFNREAGTYNTGTGVMPTGGSVMRTTGIFVKDTDSNGFDPDTRSGAIVFDHNSNGGPMIPSASDLVYTRLHNFRVQRCPAGGLAVEIVVGGSVQNCIGANPPANAKIKTITLEIMTRYFKTMPKSDWNYRSPIGGGPSGPYRDIVQTVKINFKDNVLTTNSLTGGSGEERVHGSLYFFDFIMPSTRF